MLFLEPRENLMLKLYQSCIPDVTGSIEEELRQCLEKAFNTQKTGMMPLRFEVFADLPDFESVILTRELVLKAITGLFGTKVPAFNVSAHPPARPWKIAVEACFTGQPVITSYRKYEDFNYAVAEQNGIREIWAAGLSSYSYKENTRTAAIEAFEKLVGLLKNEGMSPDNIIRQWNYIGNILSMQNGLQNYQIFNEVRSEYYGKYRTLSSFPAATGVGMKHGGVILDCVACDSKDTASIKPVDNPNQVNAYNYSQQVLKGNTEHGKNRKHPPQFERALLVNNSSGTTLYISGTASIIGQETIGRGNTVEQTYVTIENINKLADPEHVSSVLATGKACRVRYSAVRVYVKNQKDFEDAVKICSRHYSGVPSVFIEADICRDDLLIEIEAEAEISTW